ncbi:MAG: hypothetical protein GY703_09455 [Gammaproteobacteria bacterium]|nr:hypothetical protein [Gammaproteobacteria bacterium]
MPEQLYDIFFSGQILQGRNPVEVRSRIAKIFNADENALERLFSGTPVRVKAGVNEETAVTYRVAFRDAGASVNIKPCGQPAPTNLTLMPPNTGSLIDCAAEVPPVPIPDLSNLALSPEGTALDESKPAPPPVLDTSQLTLGPPRSGSLEDCHDPETARPIPDINHLGLVR